MKECRESFYSREEREKFLKTHPEIKVLRLFDYKKHCYDGHIWAVVYEKPEEKRPEESKGVV